ncbi:hypothetical protein FHL15_007960 [Xylaria flabelliformis]|uniref:Uncharacterized protein n=1 Tax=Xylaria flabelliformis TaxID=2512241 RepID=A0A553HT89_9PEZI|nr:hypothetical protein FHL15_007960 [Xylaria flabelliformis]
MDLFRGAFNLWARRDSKPTVNPAESFSDMPRRDGTSTPTPANSSPLSSATDTTASFITPTAVSPNNIEEENVARTDDEDDGEPQYYKARGLPPELKEHCRVYLEEALRMSFAFWHYHIPLRIAATCASILLTPFVARQAIFLLDSLLSTRSSSPHEPAYCPPPSQISLLCSIIVDPDFTTRPKEPDWPEISFQSLVYLRDLLAVFGPINAGFKESVLFGTNATSDLDPESHAAHDASPHTDERGLVRLSPRYGNDTVWQHGRDFFSVVGWAFNCSFLYPERWQWWSRWLGFMLDLLEKDVEERYKLDMEDTSDQMLMLQDSILASYITQRSGRTTDAIMWIMKALFADGNTPSTSVFQEVWHREHKSKSRRALNKRKREKVNIDKGEYGGYLDDESIHSSQASEPPTPQKNRVKLAVVKEDEGPESAYNETIPLRQRLFSLVSFKALLYVNERRELILGYQVSYLCYGLGDASPIDFSNLYEKFEQRIKELPLPVFSSFINSSTSALRIDQQIEMLQGVLFLFVPPGALSPRKVDRACFEEGGISPAILERCFLPYPANTIEVEDNAKMSLLLESLLMIVWQHGESVGGFSEHLGEAVRKGIEARREKINRKKPRGRGRGVTDAEIEAKAVLEASDVRLGWLADAIAEDIEDDAMGEDEVS